MNYTGRAATANGRSEEFYPSEPATFEGLGLPQTVVESLVLKHLLNVGVASGRQISDQIRLSFTHTTELMRRMKAEQFVAHRRSSGVSDYEFELTGIGAERARRLYELGTYFGTAPVALEDYCRNVVAQSPRRERITSDGLRRALGDLTLDEATFSRIGQALTSVGAMFLYGSPGNGKTSIAERITAAFGNSIWIPRAIYVEGEIIRLYDPTLHQESPFHASEGARVDQRWVRIKRPTVVVGGELTLDMLDFRMDRTTGCIEAPIHMKSNGGTLVVDDFGRQRVACRELLNRWIVPLEKGYDYVNTPSGKKIQIPFEQMITFATNLDPSDLVDEAFLRRIPYKILVNDPTDKQFVELFRTTANRLGIRHDEAAVNAMIDRWYRPAHRPFRFCQPRDLLRQVHDYCTFHGKPLELSPEAVESAATNYFSVMSSTMDGASHS